jgi:hypothetical protein
MQPHNLRDLMLGQKSLGTESLQAFRQACQDKHLNITILPSASEDQPGERGWQTIQRRMANMFQENLIKQQWLAVLFAAVVMDRTLCHGDNDRSA